MTEKKENLKVRTRFAPSPTGPLHIGGVRTALFNYLFSKKNKGDFVLRIEDTDMERSKKEWEYDLIKNFEWLQIAWDEGPVLPEGGEIDFKNYKPAYLGQHAPYRQSERKELYKKYLQELLDQGKAYYCFCTKEDVEAQKEYLMSIGEPPVYRGKCRDLTKKEAEECLKQGKDSVIRFRCPVNRKLAFDDLIRGRVEFNSDIMGDFVIAKDMENPLYNFVVVVDDDEMEISHVIRGEEHLSNTPKQLLLIEALGFRVPQYAHLPLILGTDKKKLSKRTGETSVAQYKKEGYLPEALINFIAFLGWNPGTDKEIYSLAELVSDFSMEKIQKAGAIFNIEKLMWINGFYIRKKTLKELTELLLPYWEEAGFIEKKSFNIYSVKETGEEIEFEKLEKIAALYQERLKKLSEIIEFTDLFFKKNLIYEKELLRWKQMADAEVAESLKESLSIIMGLTEKDFNKSNLEKILMAEAEKMANRGNLLWPLRAALTGKKTSAGPAEIAEALGKEKSAERIKKALSLFS
ncbi:MAG: glutamate--tRNA ligase [Candidatus Pacebacteria bacterium]|nr:glutamate--tRNA ligase [Candidatus Paceibacterota bacterium]